MYERREFSGRFRQRNLVSDHGHPLSHELAETGLEGTLKKRPGTTVQKSIRMYAKAYSADPAILVLTFAGTSTTAADYEEIVQSIEQLHRDASGRLAVSVIVVPKGHAAPNAHWRSRFADANRNRSGRYLLALVTESPLIRGVFTAVNWLMADKRNYHGYAVASFDEAMTTFEKLEGKRLGRIRELFAEAENRLRQRAVESGKEVRAL